MVVDHPLKVAGARINNSDLAVGTGGEGIDGGCAHRWDLTVIHGRDILRLPLKPPRDACLRVALFFRPTKAATDLILDPKFRGYTYRA